MIKFIDDENLIHKIYTDNNRVELLSEIIIFGEFLKKKYHNKSLSRTFYNTEEEALSDLRNRSKSLRELKDNMIKDNNYE